MDSLSNQQTFSKSDLSIGTHTIYFKVMDNEGAWSTEKTVDALPLILQSTKHQ